MHTSGPRTTARSSTCLLIRGGKRFGVEFKYSEAPQITRSMRIALEDLSLDRLWIVTAGSAEYQADERISILPLSGIKKLEATG